MKKCWLLTLLLFVFAVTLACSAAAVDYVAVPLATLGGYTYPLQMNDDGCIIGMGMTSSYGDWHIIRWQPDGSIQDLGLGYVSDINSVGEALGWPQDTPTSVWDTDCNLTILPTDIGVSFRGFNDMGQYVGDYFESYPGHIHAFLWSVDGGRIDLGILPGSNSSNAMDVNNFGEVIGISYWAQDASSVDVRAFKWTPETGIVELPHPEGTRSFPHDINDTGQVVGYISDSFGAPTSGFIWNPDGSFINLGRQEPVAINNPGQTLLFQGFIRNPDGSIVDLQPDSPNKSAADINNFGVVVGNKNEGPVVWEPVLDILVDINPGKKPNRINLRSNAKVSAAILTTSEFNAADVQPTTVRLAGAQPVDWSIQDVDRDGDSDLLLDFKTRDLSLDAASTEVAVTGSISGRRQIRGSDSVLVTPQ